MATPMSPKDLHTTFPYLARDAIYQKERPYATAFLPESNDVVLTNHIFDFMDLVVRDAQPLRESFNLQTQGFCFFKASTSLSSHNVDDERFVEKTYFDEIEALLHEKFPEYTRLECLDYQVCYASADATRKQSPSDQSDSYAEEARSFPHNPVRLSRAPSQPSCRTVTSVSMGDSSAWICISPARKNITQTEILIY